MNVISSLSIVGLLGLGFGLWAHIYLNRFKKFLPINHKWKKFRTAVMIVGLVLGVLSVPGTVFMWYPFTYNGEMHRIFGIPFMAAMMDSRGHDYVGTRTLYCMIGNSVFWYVVPQIIFALYTKKTEARIKNDLA